MIAMIFFCIREVNIQQPPQMYLIIGRSSIGGEYQQNTPLIFVPLKSPIGVGMQSYQQTKATSRHQKTITIAQMILPVKKSPYISNIFEKAPER